MARYYFDIAGSMSIVDLDGQEFAGELRALRVEVIESAREIIANLAVSEFNLLCCWFEIRDFGGQVVMIVNFSEAYSCDSFQRALEH